MTMRLLPFALLSIIVCALVNPGNFGTIDTTRRLQVARWIRLGEPPVRSADVEFGLLGKQGTREAWFGIGQSLVLVPFDAGVSATVFPVLNRLGFDSAKREQIVDLLIAFLMQSLITTGLLALAYEVLVLLGFQHRIGVAGALALLFGTTALPYVQCAQENNLLLVLALVSLYAILKCHLGAGFWWAALAGTACGFAILTRLPSLLETAVLFVLAISIGCNRKQFVAGYLPPIAAALLVDRWYQWYRFGDLFDTYMDAFGVQVRPPFSHPFWKGFLGIVFSADKSILLFDPLLVVLILVAVWRWRSIQRPVRLLVGWLAVLLLLYACTYAKYFDFGGDVAWGHRFMTLPVELLAMLAVPLLLTHARKLRRLLWVVACAAVILQVSSTMLAPNLEVIQREMGYDNGVIVNRAINLVQIAFDQKDARRFAGVSIEWQHLYYFPFQLQFRFPKLAVWAIAAWLALLACLPLLVWTALRNGSKRKPLKHKG